MACSKVGLLYGRQKKGEADLLPNRLHGQGLKSIALYGHAAGVQVNIMIWDEIDSGHNILTYTRVSKYLHGGGATTYFEGTKVSVKLMPRKSSAPQVGPPHKPISNTCQHCNMHCCIHCMQPRDLASNMLLRILRVTGVVAPGRSIKSAK